MDQADLVICLGARFDDRVTGKVSEFINHAFIVHVDIDKSELNKNKKAHIGIHGWVKDFLARITPKAAPADTADWLSHIDELKHRYPFAYEKGDGSQIKPQAFLRALDKAVAGRRTIYTTGVGQHQMWAAQYYDFPAPRRWINSGGLGTMGFGLPAAMGAKVGCPEETVVCIAGDGSVQMNMQELATCAQEGIAIKVFIMNNGYLGMVRQWQELFWDKRYSQVDTGQWPDFVKLADAYGATGMRFEDKRTLVSDIREAIATDGPVLADIRVTREENTYPMIPAGQAARDMVG
jgi:acetolactate synthase-1/2/3 large subunit